MKKPRPPSKPVLWKYKPLKPQEFYPIQYADKLRFDFNGEDVTLFDILEKTSGVDPHEVEVRVYGEYGLKIEWPDPNAIQPKNPYYDIEMKRYDKDMVSYKKAQEKYDAELVIYEEKRKRYEAEDRAYKIWFYEKELQRLKNEKLP